jgi:hypothetical protein
VSLCVFVTPSPVYDSGRYIEIWLSLYHAYQTPKLEIIAIETEKLSEDLIAVTTVMNTKLLFHILHDA